MARTATVHKLATDSKPIIVPVILSGGMGSRLWPMSRAKMPKQFMGFGTNGGSSLLNQTAKRVKSNRFAAPLVITNNEHRFLVAEHMKQAGFANAGIILEPEMRNTAPAIAAAALYVQSLYKNALMLVLPSDHVIKDEKTFAAAIERAADVAAEGMLVTFGISPEYPETGYGYIKQGTAIEGSDGAFAVSQFVEKPDSETATKYLAAGDYSWNSGMFMFPVDTLIAEMKSLQPKTYTACEQALSKAEKDPDFIRLDAESFAKAPKDSIDYAIMEKTEKAAVVPVACGWSDAGAWDSLWRIGAKDENNNVTQGTVYTRDTKDSYIHAEDGPQIATLGLENVIVVSTKDTVLVADKKRAQDVKALMEEVKEKNSELVDHHLRVQRPWGFYETIQLHPTHQVKFISVKPGAKLSVQMHHHRAEHWVVVKGTGRVSVDGEEKMLTENQYVHIPLGSVHWIENIGKLELEFIEVQFGSYLGEDDIVRFSDIYGRAGTNK